MKKIAIVAAAIMLAMQALCFTACGTNDAPALPVYKSDDVGNRGRNARRRQDVRRRGRKRNFYRDGEPDYVFTGLTINGGAVETSGQYIHRIPACCAIWPRAATFVPADVTVTFSTGGPEIADGKAVYGRPIGTLPSPVIAGKRFLGWQDADGNPVNALTTVTASARWRLRPCGPMSPMRKKRRLHRFPPRRCIMTPPRLSTALCFTRKRSRSHRRCRSPRAGRTTFPGRASCRVRTRPGCPSTSSAR